jgi:hypothetical protein
MQVTGDTTVSHKVSYDTIEVSGYVNSIQEENYLMCSGINYDFKCDSSLSGSIKSLIWTVDTIMDTSLVFTYKRPGGSGVLHVSGTLSEGCTFIDSVTLTTVYKPQKPDYLDTIMCHTGLPFTVHYKDDLDSGWVDNTILWNAVKGTDSFSVDKAGLQMVSIENQCGTVSDSFEITLDTLYGLQFPFTSRLCDEDYLVLGDSLPKIRVKYNWNTGDTTSRIRVEDSRTIELITSNLCGSQKTKTIVQFDSTPDQLNWPDSLFYCDQVDDIYDALNVGFQFKWDDGSSNQTKTITKGGWHWVEVSSGHCGSIVDSTYASLTISPSVDLGNDTLVKLPFNLTLDAGSQDAQFKWNTGSTEQQIVIDTIGLYWVEAFNQCDTVRDSILIDLKVGVYKMLGSGSITLLPNPNNGVFQVDNTPNVYVHSVLNAVGIEVPFTHLNHGRYTLQNPVPGLYYVVVQHGQYRLHGKLLVE